MANLGVKVEKILKKFYDVQQDEEIRGLYAIRRMDEPDSELLWYVFNSNNATYHEPGNDCVIRDINQSNSAYIDRLKAAFEKAKREEKKIFWLVLVFGDGIGLEPTGYDWLASIELKVDLDSITASLRMKKYPIGGDGINAWKPCRIRVEQDKYFNTTFMSCRDENRIFTSKFMNDYFEIYDNRPYHDVIKIENNDNNMYEAGELLPNEVKLCAKRIISCIYDLDAFDRIKQSFKKNTSFIKINVPNEILPTKNKLPSVFALPTGSNYEIREGARRRVFDDKEFEIIIDGEKNVCRLTTEWDDSTSSNNNLNALISVVNMYYNGLVQIEMKNGHRYLYINNLEFSMESLPDEFRSNFSKRYITSLLAKPFVILTGNSGTGKSRIAKRFAEYLEKTSDYNEKNWLLVPVGADWTDNTKILGYFNPLANEGKGEYVRTNILRFIENANRIENRKIPYFLILDEMNLSHVERYFSDFLSHMETPDTPFELDGYEGKIDYPENLFVVGTVNIDETTYMFSPKVLDRANVIEFKPQKDEVMRLFSDVGVNSKVAPANDGSAEAFLRLSKEIRTGKLEIDDEGNHYYEDEDNTKSNIEYVETVFSDIYGIVEKNDFEFAFRTVKEIRQYISAAYELAENNEFKLNQAIDEQLVQKVLPKIHGNKKEIGQLLDNLSELCDKYKLILSKKKIEQMKGKLAKVQYASFI